MSSSAECLPETEPSEHVLYTVHVKSLKLGDYAGLTYEQEASGPTRDWLLLTPSRTLDITTISDTIRVSAGRRVYGSKEACKAAMEVYEEMMDSEDYDDRKHGQGIMDVFQRVEHTSPLREWPSELLPKEPLRVWCYYSSSEKEDDKPDLDDWPTYFPFGTVGDLIDCKPGLWQVHGMDEFTPSVRTCIQLILEDRVNDVMKAVTSGLAPPASEWSDKAVIAAIAAYETTPRFGDTDLEAIFRTIFVTGFGEDGQVSTAMERFSAEQTSRFVELFARHYSTGFLLDDFVLGEGAKLLIGTDSIVLLVAHKLSEGDESLDAILEPFLAEFPRFRFELLSEEFKERVHKCTMHIFP